MLDSYSLFSLPPFMVLPFLVGVGIILIAAPMGTLMVWQRFSFFGDTLSHGALIGVATAVLFDSSPRLGILAFALLVALAMTVISFYEKYFLDTWLVVFSHGSLGLGLFMLSLTGYSYLDWTGYLFGDILLSNALDLQWVMGGGIAIGLILLRIWHPLLLLIFNEELAFIKGYKIHVIRFIFLGLLGLSIAISLKIVGALLLTALFIFPPAIARPFSKSPESMVLMACVMGLLMFTCGFYFSYLYDLPTSPVTIVWGIVLLILSRIKRIVF